MSSRFWLLWHVFDRSSADKRPTLQFCLHYGRRMDFCKVFVERVTQLLFALEAHNWALLTACRGGLVLSFDRRVSHCCSEESLMGEHVNVAHSSTRLCRRLLWLVVEERTFADSMGECGLLGFRLSLRLWLCLLPGRLLLLQRSLVVISLGLLRLLLLLIIACQRDNLLLWVLGRNTALTRIRHWGP